MGEFDIPRFCSDGCGETVIATQPTPDELEVLNKQAPDALKHWHIKCSKCGKQGFVSEFN